MGWTLRTMVLNTSCVSCGRDSSGSCVCVWREGERKRERERGREGEREKGRERERGGEREEGGRNSNKEGDV